MTQDKIIEMAKEGEAVFEHADNKILHSFSHDVVIFTIPKLKAFATAIAKQVVEDYKASLVPTPSQSERDKRVIYESLMLSISHAKITDNPFKFLFNQIKAMFDTEFSVRKPQPTSQDAERFYDLGFKASAEGYNGEYGCDVTGEYYKSNRKEAIDDAMKEGK